MTTANVTARLHATVSATMASLPSPFCSRAIYTPPNPGTCGTMENMGRFAELWKKSTGAMLGLRPGLTRPLSPCSSPRDRQPLAAPHGHTASRAKAFEGGDGVTGDGVASAAAGPRLGHGWTTDPPRSDEPAAFAGAAERRLLARDGPGRGGFPGQMSGDGCCGPPSVLFGTPYGGAAEHRALSAQRRRASGPGTGPDLCI